MKKILLSLATLASVGALAFGATTAFFSDTETSRDNIFQAGSIDIKVDSDCHYYNLLGFDVQGLPLYKDLGCEDADGIAFGEWQEDDLDRKTYKFFDFFDLKPGDWGEDTISLHVYDNDAWGRVYLENVKDYDNTCVEPEVPADPDAPCVEGLPENGGTDGELDEEMQAIVWLDQGLLPGFQCTEEDRTAGCEGDRAEGDNIWQGDEAEPLILESVADDFSYELSGILTQAYEDAHTDDPDNAVDLNEVGLFADGHMRGSITYYLGVGWCFGNYNVGLGYCDGSGVENASQTDVLSGDIGFEVEQYRNNPDPFGGP